MNSRNSHYLFYDFHIDARRRRPSKAKSVGAEPAKFKRAALRGSLNEKFYSWMLNNVDRSQLSEKERVELAAYEAYKVRDVEELIIRRGMGNALHLLAARESKGKPLDEGYLANHIPSPQTLFKDVDYYLDHIASKEEKARLHPYLQVRDSIEFNKQVMALYNAGYRHGINAFMAGNNEVRYLESLSKYTIEDLYALIGLSYSIDGPEVQRWIFKTPSKSVIGRGKRLQPEEGFVDEQREKQSSPRL